jgi:hypothetical protein
MRLHGGQCGVKIETPYAFLRFPTDGGREIRFAFERCQKLDPSEQQGSLVNGRGSQ